MSNARSLKFLLSLLWFGIIFAEDIGFDGVSVVLALDEDVIVRVGEKGLTCQLLQRHYP